MTTSGPYERWVNLGNPVMFTKHTLWYRQKPITSAPLSYQMDLVKTTGSIGHAARTDDYIEDAELWSYNKCYSKFVNAVNASQAAIGADLGERHSTMGMLVSRARQLLVFTRNIRAGHWTQAARTLGMKKPKSTGHLVANTGDAWLEYSFGWKPLIQDIFAAVDVLQQPWPHDTARARNTYSMHYTKPIYKGFEEHWHEYKTLIQSRVVVENWPVWKANQLGLINPLSVAWELVPFSFVVDWFVPVGTFIQSLTDFVGLSLPDAFVTRSRRHYVVATKEAPYSGAGTHLWVRIWRDAGSIPKPKLHSQFTGFYSARGANAIALLASALRGIKP